MDAQEIAPNATVYVRGLDEKQKIPALTEALRSLFGTFGEIVEVIAKRSIKRRGQAFIVYDNAESAQEAIDELQGFDLFGEPMKLAFAKTRSDATVKREQGDEALESHKKQRMAVKEQKQAAENKQRSAKRAAEESAGERPAKSAKSGQLPPGAVPHEFLPPNKTLVLRDLPADYGTAALNAVFGRFGGFKEIRTVPGRHDIAFAEYVDEDSSTAAKTATDGVELGGSKISVTYQRT